MGIWTQRCEFRAYRRQPHEKKAKKKVVADSCSALGARLCTLPELKAAKNKGCGKKLRVWTSTTCSKVQG